MIDYLQPPLGYLLRIPCGDHAANSPLDEPARDRAEQAAAFLRFERIGRICETNRPAARETAQIVWLSCTPDFTDYIYASAGVDEFCDFLLNEDRGLPCVLVAAQREIEAALQRLGISPANQPGDPESANVCGEGAVSNQQSALGQSEIVAPGGIISLHQADTGIIARARHMVLDFRFTDLEKAVAWGNAGLAIEKPAIGKPAHESTASITST